MLKKLLLVGAFAVAMTFSAGVAHADSITVDGITYTGMVSGNEVTVTVQCGSSSCAGWYLEDVSLKGFTWTVTPTFDAVDSSPEVAANYSLELGGMNVSSGCDGTPATTALCWEDSGGLMLLGTSEHIFVAETTGSFSSTGSLSLQALGFATDSTDPAGGNKVIAVSDDLTPNSAPEPGTLLLLGFGLLGLVVVRRHAPSA